MTKARRFHDIKSRVANPTIKKNKLKQVALPSSKDKFMLGIATLVIN